MPAGCPFGVCAAMLKLGIVGDGNDGIVPLTGCPVPVPTTKTNQLCYFINILRLLDYFTLSIQNFRVIMAYAGLIKHEKELWVKLMQDLK